MQNSGRRRGFQSWFVEPYRQIKLGLVFLLLNLFFVLLLFSVLGYYFWDVYRALTVYFYLSPDQGREIFDKLSIPLWSVFGLLVLFVIATILVSVRYTHRIYGPLVSIHRFLDDLIQGKVSESLSLRESDQLQGLATRLNEVAIMLQKRK